MNLAHTADVIGFDPALVTGAQWPMFAQVYNVLVFLDQDMKPQPELAESWEFSDEYKTLTLKLRPGVKFHSGRELTAEDVVWNIKRAQDPKAGYNVRPVAEKVKSAEAKDKWTVVLRYESYFAPALDMLDALYIMDPTAEADVKQKGGGTGPFKVDSWQPGSHARLVRNSSYWRQGYPYLDEVVLRAMPDEWSMVVAIEANHVDLAESVPPREWARLQKAGRLQTIKGPVATMVCLLMNCSKPPLDNKKVRQGIGAALDRKQYVELFVRGASEPYCLGFPPTSLAFNDPLNKACMPDFNLAKAKRLLSEGGYPNGFSISTVTGVPGSAPFSKEIAEKMQADLKQIGVNLSITHVEAAENARRIVDSDFELINTHYARFQRDPATLFGASQYFQPEINKAKFRSPQYTQMVKDAESTPDPAKRKALYKQLSEFILEEAWVHTLFPRYLLFAAQPYVNGLSFNRDGFERLEGVWLDKAP